jgi:hypothetical protein
MEKHSAYKSMRTKGNKTSAEDKANLIRWKNERWINLTALQTDKQKLPCGTKGKKQIELGLPSICRPTVKINDKTPTLASSYTKKQIVKAIKVKKGGEIIKWSKL